MRIFFLFLNDIPRTLRGFYCNNIIVILKHEGRQKNLTKRSKSSIFNPLSCMRFIIKKCRHCHSEWKKRNNEPTRSTFFSCTQQNYHNFHSLLRRSKKKLFFVVAGFFIFFGNDTYNNVDEHTHGPKERKIAGRKSLEAFHVAETTNDDNGACVCGQTREWLTVTGAGDDDDDDEDSRSKKKKKKNVNSIYFPQITFLSAFSSLVKLKI